MLMRVGSVGLLLFAAACSSAQQRTDHAGPAFQIQEPPQQVRVPGSHVDPLGPGVDLLPIHVPRFIFGQPTDDPQVQPGTSSLVGSLGRRHRLDVVALPSPSGTVAVDFKELSPPGSVWGEVMFPAERALFRAFAKDPSLGDYLVVLTDVEVLRASDPIPLTAYRWARQDVVTYAGCGIPDSAIDACTLRFYQLADTRIVDVGAIMRGA
jgi:hypothetical protein